jgi:hypothetical protein
MEVTDAQRQTAEAIQENTDAAIEAFYLLVVELDKQMAEAARRDDRTLMLAAIGWFLADLEILLRAELVDAHELGLALLRQYFPANIIAIMPDYTEADAIITVARQAVERQRLVIEQQATQTGLSEVQLGRFGILTRGQIYDLRKAVDAMMVRIVHETMYNAGSGVYQRKIAVAVLDKHTTRLCRNRMDGQIRAWDEPYVDPLTGAQWLYPPFIGGGLPPAEAFHFCRTVSVPYLGEANG